MIYPGRHNSRIGSITRRVLTCWYSVIEETLVHYRKNDDINGVRLIIAGWRQLHLFVYNAKFITKQFNQVQARGCYDDKEKPVTKTNLTDSYMQALATDTHFNLGQVVSSGWEDAEALLSWAREAGLADNKTGGQAQKGAESCWKSKEKQSKK